MIVLKKNVAVFIYRNFSLIISKIYHLLECFNHFITIYSKQIKVGHDSFLQRDTLLLKSNYQIIMKGEKGGC
jgi:hypothetical protein